MSDRVTIPIDRLSVEQWWERREDLLVVDVRSPAEFSKDRLPGALSMPVLDNDERALVGTLYASSPFEARILGARLIARNIARILEDPIWQNLKKDVLVYCWRGGQRSLSLGIVLKEIGFRVYLLQGGYRSFRRHVVKELWDLPSPYRYWVFCGPTGSGKTALLRFFQGSQFFGETVAVLDLEGIAQHRGSVFGEDPRTPQPSQKLFESRLWYFFRTLPSSVRHILVEDESRRIGCCEIPPALWEKMKQGTRIVVFAPLEERVRRILWEYPIPSEDELSLYLRRLLPHLGRDLYERLLSLAQSHRWEEFVALLLKEHYDPLYARVLRKREEAQQRLYSEIVSAPLRSGSPQGGA